MKRVFAVFLALGIILLLCACGASAAKPEDTVTAFNEAMRDFDLDKMQSCTASGNVVVKLNLEEELGEKLTAKMKEWASQITYETESITEEGDHGTAVVRYSYVDANPVAMEFFRKYVNEANAAAWSGESEKGFEALAAKILEEALNTVETGETERVVEYPLIRVNREWKIEEVPQEVLYILTADYLAALNSIAESIYS